MSEWKECKLTDVVTIIGGGTPKTAVPSYWNGTIPWLSVADFNNGNRYVFLTEKHISEEGLNNSSTRYLEKGDVIISARGTVGAIAQLGIKMTFNQSCYGIRAKSVSNNDYIYYLLHHCVQNLRQQANGGVFDTIIKETFGNIGISLPLIDEQNRIVDVLSSLDDKINLLNKQNATLEELAQTNFRQWFVENTKGVWEEKGLDEIAYFLNGLPLQNHPYRNGNPLFVIKIREMNNGFSDSSDICQNDIPLKYLVNPGDVVFSWSGSLEIQLWKYGKGALNQHLFKVTSDKYSKWFYYYWIKHYLPDFRSIAESKATTMGHIQRGHISSAKVLIPNNDELVLMNDIMEPLIEKIELNNSQINELKSLRDTLLPKLISGEVRVRQ